jgi:hypothetical protein
LFTQKVRVFGKKGASKLSSTVTGRRKKVLPDGSWTWEYPKK